VPLEHAVTYNLFIQRSENYLKLKKYRKFRQMYSSART